MGVRDRRLRRRTLAHQRHHGGGDHEVDRDAQKGIGVGLHLRLPLGERPELLQRCCLAVRAVDEGRLITGTDPFQPIDHGGIGGVQMFREPQEMRCIHAI